ncbi:MAG: replicative DNA helicase [Parcubacteria group bacterium]|nr:replicative DNA helicase [Parcubacteria group bacterium]
MPGEQQNTNQVIRIPPQNIESEKALLGSVMLRPEAMFEIVDTLSPDAFYTAKHRLLYQTMLDLHHKKEPIDLLSLSARLKEKNHLDSIGGRSYLAELVNLVPSSTNAKYYAELVQRKFLLRELLGASDYIGELGYDEMTDIEELLDRAEKKIFGITGISNLQTFVTLKESLAEAWERLDALHKTADGLRGVPTGFREIDNLLAGFQKSDLVILAARPSMGKTSLALDIARQSARGYGIPVGVFSLEMSAQQLVDRMLAAESRVDAWKLRTGRIKSDEDFVSIQNALDRLSSAPIFIDDTPGNTVLRMRSVARRLKREYGLGLLIIDYLQLIGTTRSYDSLVHQVTEISRSLKGLARELDVPVLALSQLSRAVEQRRDRPRLSDLRDSGSIEQDADVVMFIHREDRYKDESERTNITEILVEKHRNGPCGKVELYFDEKRSSFLSLEKDRGTNPAAAAPAAVPSASSENDAMPL